MADQDPSLKTQDPHAPLELIAEGKYTIEAICIESGMSILELAAHVCTPQNLEILGRVAQLHATQREMLLGRLKRDALVRLAELTDEVPAGSADEVRAAEVMRKACADILRFENGPTRSESRNSDPGGPRSGGHHPDSITPAFEAEVLEALERLGEEAIQYEPCVPGDPPNPPRRASGSVGHPSPKMQSSFISQPGEEPVAYASGSLSKCTGKMPMPLKSTPPPESSPESPPESPTALEVLETRTGGTPMPPKIRRMANRIPNNDDRILPDDAHPP